MAKSNDDRIIEAADGNMGALSILAAFPPATLITTLDVLEKEKIKGEMIYWMYVTHCGGEKITFFGELVPGCGAKLRPLFEAQQ